MVASVTDSVKRQKQDSCPLEKATPKAIFWDKFLSHLNFRGASGKTSYRNSRLPECKLLIYYSICIHSQRLSANRAFRLHNTSRTLKI